MDAPLSKHERLRLQAEQYAKASEQLRSEEGRSADARRRRWYVIGTVSLVVLVGLGVFFVASPGKYDRFAQCLKEKGAVMYGAIDWCSYTKSQANMFGKSFKYVEYRDYSELEGIGKTPTWVFEGEWLAGVQSFERLAAVTGCSYS